MPGSSVLDLDSIIEEQGKNIEKTYGRLGINIHVTNWENKRGLHIFTVKLKGNTLKEQIRARAPDVQQRLGFKTFRIQERDLIIRIIVARETIEYQHLPECLADQECEKECQSMQLPYTVGYDEVGELVNVDLAQLWHLLVGGASNSGKTVGLQSLIISIIYRMSPQQVNFILIDVGAADLISFNEIPHLACPVVDDREKAYQVLILLMNEMERRIKLEKSDTDWFNQLPELVLVVDEFPALFTGMNDKRTDKRIINAVSSLLQRGRHAKIHIVLAAQNPTIRNMKVDIGNITARIAFRCAKRNFSETIIGEGGAENLSGKGDMFFKYPQYEGARRIQGIYISTEELSETLRDIQEKWESRYYDTRNKFTIHEADLQQANAGITDILTERVLTEKEDMSNRMFVKVLLWVLEQDTVSCNLLMRKFSIGWKRADDFMAILNAIGIVENLDAKLPRKVIVKSLCDLTEKQVDLLLQTGITQEEMDSLVGSNG